MIDTSSSLNINRQLYEPRYCAHCWTNGTIKKYKILFKYSYSARVCGHCIEILGGPGNTATWLEKNATFDAKGGLYFPQKEVPKNA